MSTGVVNGDPVDALARTDVVGVQPARTEDALVFFRALRVSRLFPEAEIRALEGEFLSSTQLSLADVLLYSGKLTRYQFDRLSDGEALGLVVGPYQILDELGRGGGGRVYQARHTVMNRTVALKVIDPRYTADRSAAEVFRREVAATTRLAHPNVVQVYDAYECDGVFYIAMELMPGPTLHRYVTENGAMEAALACTAMLQLAAALDHAHESGLVHRDIKPANIMFSPGRATAPREVVKILDFGLARLCQQGDQQVSTIHCPEGAAIGTPAFMSPEQIRNFHAADVRSDLYSLGCTFYFALSGQLPFQGATTSVTLMMQLNREPAPLWTVCPLIPPGLARIVHRLMAKNPADRYQTPGELIDALNGFLLSDGLGASGAARPTPVAPTPVARIPSVTADVPPRPVACAVPTGRAAPPANGALSKLWDEWCEVLVTGTRGDGVGLSERSYQALHRQLIEALRAARDCPTAGPTALFDWALEHVEPWVTLASLSRLDERTRAELYMACQNLSDKLFPGHASGSGSGWLVPASGVLLAAAVYFLVWSWPRWSAAVPNVSEVSAPRYLIAAALLIPVFALIGVFARRKGTRA